MQTENEHPDYPGWSREDVERFRAAERIAHQHERQRTARFKPQPAPDGTADISDFVLNGESVTSPEVIARAAAYHKAKAKGLIRYYTHSVTRR